MRTDITLRFQWANNRSESVFCLCALRQLKCQLAPFGHFQMQRQMSALVGRPWPGKVFFFGGWGEVVGTYSYPFFTDIGVFFWNEVWLPGSHKLPFLRERRDSSWKTPNLCNYRRKLLGFHFHFFYLVCQCVEFAWQGFGCRGATGVDSLRSC